MGVGLGITKLVKPIGLGFVGQTKVLPTKLVIPQGDFKNSDLRLKVKVKYEH